MDAIPDAIGVGTDVDEFVDGRGESVVAPAEREDADALRGDRTAVEVARADGAWTGPLGASASADGPRARPQGGANALVGTVRRRQTRGLRKAGYGTNDRRRVAAAAPRLVTRRLDGGEHHDSWGRPRSPPSAAVRPTATVVVHGFNRGRFAYSVALGLRVDGPDAFFAKEWSGATRTLRSAVCPWFDILNTPPRQVGRMPTLMDTHIRNRHIVNPNDANILETAHGGNVMMWMDEVGAMSAMRFAGHQCVTARMDQTNFRRPIPQGDAALVEAYVYDAGETSVKVRVKVFRENLRTGETELTTESYMVFVAIDEDRDPAEVPELTVASDQGERLRKEALDGDNGNAEH